MAAAKETGSGALSVVVAGCLAQASASSLPAMPWWSGIHSSLVLQVYWSSTCLRSAVSAELLWIVLRSCSTLLLREEGRGVGRIAFCCHHSCATI